MTIVSGEQRAFGLKVVFDERDKTYFGERIARISAGVRLNASGYTNSPWLSKFGDVVRDGTERLMWIGHARRVERGDGACATCDPMLGLSLHRSHVAGEWRIRR